MSTSSYGIDDKKKQELVQKLLTTVASDAESAESKLKTLAKLLVSSDVTFYNVIIHYQFTQGIIPQYNPKSPPSGYPAGLAELGPFLYWLTTESPPESWSWEYKAIWYALQLAIEGLVGESVVSQKLYDEMKGYVAITGIPASDGTLYGLKMYEQLDDHWLEAVMHYLYYKLAPSKIADFVATEPNEKLTPIQLQGASSSEVKIAIIGDWGTGKYDPDKTYSNQDGSVDGPALDVMNSLSQTGIQPDYIIHLGDVYYAGTDNNAIIGSAEEQDNLVAVWSSTSTTNFTLNSNHEMYGGANGYFDVALTSGLFSQQDSRSFFVLEYADWTLIGLDSAYYCDDDNLYMDGRVTDPSQKTQLAAYKDNAANVMLFSHHNAVNVEGTEAQTLWGDVTASDALTAAPGYWFWGHIHLGVAYSSAATNGSTTKMRCVGHGAVPNGSAWGLLDNDVNIPQVDYFAHTLVDKSRATTTRVFNGFAVITISASDSSVTEEFYELESSGQAVLMWSTPAET